MSQNPSKSHRNPFKVQRAVGPGAEFGIARGLQGPTVILPPSKHVPPTPAGVLLIDWGHLPSPSFGRGRGRHCELARTGIKNGHLWSPIESVIDHAPCVARHTVVSLAGPQSRDLVLTERTSFDAFGRRDLFGRPVATAMWPQPMKAMTAELFREAGRCTDLKELQSWKANFPISVTESGITRLVKELQCWKAPIPM